MEVTLKNPSAWVPLALSGAMLLILAMYLGHIIPSDPTGDEGTGAHLFQLWLFLELCSLIFFVIKWLPKKPHRAVRILFLQIACALIPIATVFFARL